MCGRLPPMSPRTRTHGGTGATAGGLKHPPSPPRVPADWARAVTFCAAVLAFRLMQRLAAALDRGEQPRHLDRTMSATTCKRPVRTPRVAARLSLPVRGRSGSPSNSLGSSPILQIQSATRRAYWRVVMQWLPLLAPRETRQVSCPTLATIIWGGRFRKILRRSAALQPYSPIAGHGFRLGATVRKQGGISPLAGSSGDYAWGGACGTSFWIDPKEKLAVVFMSHAPSAATACFRYRQLKCLVIQALAP